MFVAGVGLPARGGRQSRHELSQVPHCSTGAVPCCRDGGFLLRHLPAQLWSAAKTSRMIQTWNFLLIPLLTALQWQHAFQAVLTPFLRSLKSCRIVLMAHLSLVPWNTSSERVIAATAVKRPRFGLEPKRATGTKGHLILAGQRSSCSRKESFTVTNTKHVHFTSRKQWVGAPGRNGYLSEQNLNYCGCVFSLRSLFFLQLHTR